MLIFLTISLFVQVSLGQGGTSSTKPYKTRPPFPVITGTKPTDIVRVTQHSEIVPQFLLYKNPKQVNTLVFHQPDENTRLMTTVHSCWVTENPGRDSLPRYDAIQPIACVSGLKTQTTKVTINNANTTVQIAIPRFPDSTADTVYFHCQINLCKLDGDGGVILTHCTQSCIEQDKMNRADNVGVTRLFEDLDVKVDKSVSAGVFVQANGEESFDEIDLSYPATPTSNSTNCVRPTLGGNVEITSANRPYYFGDRMTFQCINGKEVTGGDNEITCSTGGTWHGTVLKCSGVMLIRSLVLLVLLIVMQQFI